MIYGADVSMTHEVEKLGGSFSNPLGEAQDLFSLLAHNGVNLVRLRVWVDPKDRQGSSYLGGSNDMAVTTALARRAKAAGLGFMLNIHYSDFWTDPKKQMLPKAWVGKSFEELLTTVREYTVSVLEHFVEQVLIPDYVQVGNEITNGMLWPYGQTAYFDFDTQQYGEIDTEADKRLAEILKVGIGAIKVVADIPTIIHLDFGGSNALYRSFFDRMGKHGLKPEIIGLSYYPFWHGTLGDLERNLVDITERYDADVMVVETAFPHTEAEPPNGHYNLVTGDMARECGYDPSVDGQSKFLRDLIKCVQNLPDGRGLGIVYWEPAWLPVQGTSWTSEAGKEYGNDRGALGNTWANQALFDYEGRALESLSVLGGM